MSALVERLLGLGEGSARLLAARGEHRVYEHDGVRWLHSGGRSVQSALRLDAPGEVQLPALWQMLAALLVIEAPRRALNLGFGGGSFERFLARGFEHCQVCSVEQSAEVLALARDWLAVPARGEVLIDSAERALEHLDERFELILCDLFVGETHAACLRDEAFHARLADCLSANGVAAFNLSPASEAELIEVLLPLRKALPWVMLSNVADCGNVVLLAMRAAPPPPELVARRAAELSARTGQDFTALPDHFTCLPPPPGDQPGR